MRFYNWHISRSRLHSIQESPTLDLANDCSHFVTGYFGIIDSSSPHIYHSALALTPKTSTIRKLYGSYARPFTRVVHGLPASWDSSIASTTFPFPIELVVWSPCNKFIAVSVFNSMMVDILDSATLQRLHRLIFSRERYARSEAFVFSPDSCTLTCSGCGSAPDQEVLVVSWDLQTGGVVSAIERQGLEESPKTEPLITYSMNGRMVAVHRHSSAPIISIYDVVSGVYMHDVHHNAPVDRHILIGSCFPDIWAHGETLRFATIEPRTITIWEVGFNPGATSIMVETLSIPPDVEYFQPISAQFLPTSGRYSLVYSGARYGVLVWDGQDVRSSVLDTNVDLNRRVSFSSDGRLFAYFTSNGSEAYIWKEYSAGYVLHAKPTPNSQYPELPHSSIITIGSASPKLLLSPNGESIVEYDGSSARLRHTKNFTTPSDTSTRAPDSRSNFVLEFHPDRPLAAVARQTNDAVIILDLKSGAVQLTIETGMEVQGLRIARNMVAVVGDWKVVAWNLPGGDYLPDSRVDVETSAQTINFQDQRARYGTVSASISLDFRYVALTSKDWFWTTMRSRLHVYDVSTGQHLCRDINGWDAVWFHPGGDSVWCAIQNRAEVVEISWEGVDDATNMDDTAKMDEATGMDDAREVVGIEHGSWGCPWGSSRGYMVTNDGWILGPDGKRLLMLPLPWRSHAVRRVWSGNFVALLHDTLAEPIILELEL